MTTMLVLLLLLKVEVGVVTLSAQQPAGNLLEEIQKAGATTALSLLRSAGLEDTLRIEFYSLFVPTNEAFKTLPKEWQIHLNVNVTARRQVLQYHAVSAIFRIADAFNNLLLNSTLGREVHVNIYLQTAAVPPIITVEGGRILQGDIEATNGYLHLVNRVLLPPAGDLYHLLVISPHLSSFKTWVDLAGTRNEVVEHQGTLLAPSNDAFTALVTSLGLSDYNRIVNNHELIREIVLYHLLVDVLFSDGVTNGTYTTKDMAGSLDVVTGSGGMIHVHNGRVT